jgi:hypothetical protein
LACVFVGEMKKNKPCFKISCGFLCVSWCFFVVWKISVLLSKQDKRTYLVSKKIFFLPGPGHILRMT